MVVCYHKKDITSYGEITDKEAMSRKGASTLMHVNFSHITANNKVGHKLLISPCQSQRYLLTITYIQAKLQLLVVN